MKQVNNYYYFAKLPEEILKEVEIPKNWTEPYDFRVSIDTRNGEIEIEDICGRKLPMCFGDIKGFRKVLKRILEDICYE